METNQDRWNKVRSVEKELEELERDIENISFRQLAELSGCVGGAIKYSPINKKRRRKGKIDRQKKKSRRRSIDLKEGRGGVITEDVCKRLRESVWLSFWGFLYRWGMKTKHHDLKEYRLGTIWKGSLGILSLLLKRINKKKNAKCTL